jgi:predicted amidohydrolase YtcJ
MTTIVYQARKIITMNPMQPQATYVAVRDGRVLAVGTLDDMHAWGDFELDNRFADKVLMPGLVEGHCHLKEGSMWDWAYVGWFDRRDPNGKVWSGLRSMEAVVERLSEIDAEMKTAGRPDTDPLIAWGFDPIYFGGERMTVAHVDRVSVTRPIIISHANGHLMNVNTAMLRLAEITRDNEVEGVVKFGASAGALMGEPTGELQEPAAMFLVVRKVGDAGLLAPMTEAGVRSFARLACMQGVTTATDLVNKLTEDDCNALEAVTADDACSVRILPAFQAFHGTHGAPQGAEHVKSLLPRNTDRLRYGLGPVNTSSVHQRRVRS